MTFIEGSSLLLLITAELLKQESTDLNSILRQRRWCKASCSIVNAAFCSSFQRRYRFGLCFPEPITRGKPEVMNEIKTRAARQSLSIRELFLTSKERALNSPHTLNRPDISVLLPMQERRGRGQIFARTRTAF